MRVHLVNPNHLSFGMGVITPRWLYVIAAATPPTFGDPVVVDETLHPFDPSQIQAGDVVGIGIHSGNALRGYEVGQMARERGAYVIFGGIHTGLYPEEAYQRGGAHAVVQGDGDVVWGKVVADCTNGGPRPLYQGGRIEPDQFLPARWDLMPRESYMVPSVQTVRGCPKHCSFCSVWRTDGQRPRQRASDVVIQEIVELRRKGYRAVLLADDNFYPVTLEDLRLAERQQGQHRLGELQALREERFDLMARLAELPEDMVFFTQITMEVADDLEFLDAMRKARIRGALVGIETVTPEGVKAIFKEFNATGESLVRRLQTLRENGLQVLGSFIFGLSTDRPDTFDLTLRLALEAEVAFAQFVLLTPFPGTVDFDRWEKKMETDPTRIAGLPLTRYWLMPQAVRPKVYTSHPVMSSDEIRRLTQSVWDRFYDLRTTWKRSARSVKSFRSRVAFLVLSRLYRQMYANTGIATDSARVNRAQMWARLLSKPFLRLFHGDPMPQLEMPGGSAPPLQKVESDLGQASALAQQEAKRRAPHLINLKIPD